MKSRWGVAARVAAKVGLTALLFIAVAPCAHADLLGTVPVAPNGTVVPSLVPPGTYLGTLLASEALAFTSFTGSDSGTILSAVYEEAGGTLDFYYQVDLDATSTNCGGSGQIACDALERVTASSFAGVPTSVGYLIDGSFLGNGFTDGTEIPFTTDRSLNSSVVGFNFNSPGVLGILPGTDSVVFVVSTNATAFTNGFVSVIDGIPSTVTAFEPASGTAVPAPEPGTLTLFSSGLIGLGLAGLRRRSQRLA